MRTRATALVWGLLAILAAPALAAPQARVTVAVAPFTTASSEEYRWIGPALAGALVLRVHRQPELNVLTLRQVNAAMRHEGRRAEDLATPAAALEVGRALGADVLVAGTYEARWPDIEVALHVYDPRSRKLRHSRQVTGGLDDLAELEARIAKEIAVDLGAESPQPVPGAFGTQNLRAWRLTTLALDILDWQSLSPRAADPKTPLGLPTSAIKKARGYLEDAVRYDPDYGEAWAALGVAQALAGENASAWRSFGKATALGFGHHPTAVLGAAFVRMREGRFDEAGTILGNAIDRHPGFLHARGYLGELAVHRGDFQRALQIYDAYAEVVPDQPWVLTQRGYVRSKLGDHAGAIADATAAVDLLPDSAYLLLELASRYIDADKLLGAEDVLKRAIAKHPQESTAYVRLGYVYLLQGKDELAIPITERALANAEFGRNQQRDRAYAHLNLVRAYGRQGRLDDAFEHLARAKALGGVSYDELHRDPGLEALRKDRRFKKLLP